VWLESVPWRVSNPSGFPFRSGTLGVNPIAWRQSLGRVDIFEFRLSQNFCAVKSRIDDIMPTKATTTKLANLWQSRALSRKSTWQRKLVTLEYLTIRQSARTSRQTHTMSAIRNRFWRTGFLSALRADFSTTSASATR
jgi:hypothetical protein